MQIQKLEEDLGVVLFDRSKKPILLTEAGKKLIEQFQSVLFEAKKIEGILESHAGNALSGTLTLGVIPTIAPYLLPSLLPTLEEHCPEIELNILELQTHQIIEALNNDEIDVAILAIPLNIAKIFTRSLYFEPFSVLCHKDHELAQLKKIKHSALSGNDIWLLQEGHCMRNQVLDVCSIKLGKGAKRRYRFESGSLETLKNLVNSYGGYTLIPAMASGNSGAHTQQIPFEHPVPAREVGLVYRREHFKIQLIEALGEAILKSIPGNIRKIKAKDLEVLPVE